MVGNAMINALIAAGVVFAIGFGWITHLQNRGQRRSRAGGGSDGGGDSYTGTNDGFLLGSWFSGDSAGNSSDGGNCSADSSGGGDCSGGGDGGGGGD